METLAIDQDEKFLRESIELAREAAAAGDPPFGSVLVKNGETVARGRNTSATDSDFRLHGEMNAFQDAMSRHHLRNFEGMTIYASGEPCPMCSGAIYWSGIRRVVYGCPRTALTEIRGFGLDMASAEILSKGSHDVEVIGPMLEDEIVEIYRDFYKKR